MKRLKPWQRVEICRGLDVWRSADSPIRLMPFTIAPSPLAGFRAPLPKSPPPTFQSSVPTRKDVAVDTETRYPLK